MYPRLLLITDCALGDRSSGISRTLANLLDNYPEEKLLILTSHEAIATEDIGSKFEDSCIVYRQNPLGKLGRRVPFLKHTYLDNQACPAVKEISEFRPEIILLCTNSLDCLIVADKISGYFSCPLVVYTMDDWRDHDQRLWIGRSGKKVIHSLMKKAVGWIAVSKALLRTFAKRYALTAPASIVAHNPVLVPNELLERDSGRKLVRLVYAGSIWPMHANALVLVARGVEELREQGIEVELVVHTSQDFWDQNRSQLDLDGVIFGGFISYEKLPEALRNYDIGVVASSFNPEHRHLAEGSVQTKLTDYMAEGLAILSCGPVYGVCNEFVLNWGCGECLDTPTVEAAKAAILSMTKDVAKIDRLGEVGWQAAHKHFSKEAVQNSFYSFLSECSKL